MRCQSGETSGNAESGPDQIDVEVPAKTAAAPGMMRTTCYGKCPEIVGNGLCAKMKLIEHV